MYYDFILDYTLIIFELWEYEKSSHFLHVPSLKTFGKIKQMIRAVLSLLLVLNFYYYDCNFQ